MSKTVIVKSYKGFIRLPLAMAHGMLSDLPIEYGIYSDLFGCIFFTLFSTSRHTSAGSAAFLMMIIGSSIESNFGSEAERNIFSFDGQNFNLESKVECVFSMVICSEFRLGRYRDDDQGEHHFNLSDQCRP